jgi:hypothetical protein
MFIYIFKEQVSQIAVHQNECDRTRQLLNEIESNSKRSHKEVKETIFDLRKQSVLYTFDTKTVYFSYKLSFL